MWRFVHISDPHLGSDTDGQWNNRVICTMMPYVMTCLRRDLADSTPDFILATGDLASTATPDAVYAARDLMDSLGFPYYPIGGNHDFVSEDTRAWFREAFQAHLPGGNLHYSFTHKNIHCCMLDPWWIWADGALHPYSENPDISSTEVCRPGSRWALPEDQLAWLDQDLAKHAGIPTIIGAHYPAVPIPQRLRRPAMKDAGCLENGPELTAILKDHPHVKACFAGHVHMHFIQTDDSLTHVVTGALPEYPTEYRIIDVYDDRLEIAARQLGDNSFAARSLIPGREWTAGEPRDRKATVPLE